jgi:hypothetical protein
MGKQLAKREGMEGNRPDRSVAVSEMTTAITAKFASIRISKILPVPIVLAQGI